MEATSLASCTWYHIYKQITQTEIERDEQWTEEKEKEEGEQRHGGGWWVDIFVDRPLIFKQGFLSLAHFIFLSLSVCMFACKCSPTSCVL